MIVNRGAFYYCESCGAFTQKEPSENMLKLMERLDILTWTFDKICDKCLKLGAQAPEVKDSL